MVCRAARSEGHAIKFASASLLLLLTACGSMNVTVSVINPKIAAVAQDEFLLRDLLPGVHALDAEKTTAAYQVAANRHTAVLNQIATDYDRQAHSLGSPRGDKFAFAATDLREITIPLVARKYITEAAGMIALEDRIRTADDATPRNESLIASLLRERTQRKRAFIVASGQGLDAMVRSAQNAGIGVERDVLIADLQRQQTTALDNLLIGDANVTAFREAFAVTTAKSEDWSPRFDQSVGTGRFGRVDVAIKMESRGVFTIKGITFDPSEVVRIAAKATTQALLIGAQIAGVPVPKRTGATGDGVALATSSGELNDLAAQQTTNATKTADRQAALVELATSILAQEPGLEATDDATFRAALTAIKAKSTAANTRLTQ